MKLAQTLLLFLVMSNGTTLNAQSIKMTKAVDDIIHLGKDSVVHMALQLMDEKVNQGHFTKIEVSTNGIEVVVSFLNPIKFLPPNTACFFEANVSLIGKNTSKFSLSNPADKDKQNITFYKETEETRSKIEFVIQAINASDQVGAIDDSSDFVDDMTIRENENYYDVIVVSVYQESSFKIAKGSGEIYDAQHAALEPAPFESDEESYEKVNWD